MDAVQNNPFKDMNYCIVTIRSSNTEKQQHNTTEEDSPRLCDYT